MGGSELYGEGTNHYRTSLEERLARLEQIAEDNRVEIQRTRGRLHDLEKATQGLLDLQRDLHRQNEAAQRRQALAIQRGSLLMSAALIVLAAVQIFLSLYP